MKLFLCQLDLLVLIVVSEREEEGADVEGGFLDDLDVASLVQNPGDSYVQNVAV